MELLGHGSYANIYKLNNDKVIKKYKNELNEGVAPDMLREVSILRNIMSPYIIEIHEINFDSIVLPLYKYNLTNYIKTNVVNIKNFFHSICSGIYILHSYGIAHRDLKPSNILVKNSDTGVLIDFGFSKRLEYDRDFNDNTPKIITSWYRPPEVFDEQKYHFEVDIWSAGVILAELYNKEHLFDYESDFNIVNSQCFLMGTPQNYFKNIKVKEFPGNFDQKFQDFSGYDLLKGMLTINHLERFDITKCLNSTYFNKDKVISNKIIYNNYLEDYILDLNDLNHEILPLREILVLWMLEVCGNSHVTYFRSVVLLDKFIHLNKQIKIKRTNFQLIGMVCIWLASKLENIHFITKQKLIYMSDNSFTDEEMIKMEKIVLQELNFNLNTCVLYNYISLYSKRLNLNKENINLLNKYLHICTVFPEYYNYNFSDIAYICANLSIEDGFELSEDLEILKKHILRWTSHKFEDIENKFNNLI